MRDSIDAGCSQTELVNRYQAWLPPFEGLTVPEKHCTLIDLKKTEFARELYNTIIYVFVVGT